jgi:hypothetical protein
MQCLTSQSLNIKDGISPVIFAQPFSSYYPINSTRTKSQKLATCHVAKLSCQGKKCYTSCVKLEIMPVTKTYLFHKKNIIYNCGGGAKFRKIHKNKF